jgi:hypothetical protein
MSKNQYFEKALTWAKRNGMSDLKANFEDYETPTTFSKEGEDSPYIPDITGSKNGHKSYLEIATKNGEVGRKVSKWKLLSTLASMKNGKLFLLAPKGHKAFTEKLVKQHDLNAEIVYLR